MEHEELAIIRGVDFGMRDAGTPTIWFSVEGLWGGSLQTFSGVEALAFVRKAECYSIRSLEGKPCVVEVGGGLVRFKHLWPQKGGE